LEEALLAHTRMSRAARRAEVAGALRRVGLDAGAAEGYPGRFSGGQLQRVAIARALLLSPRLVICDEPVSSLDLSIQAQILNLLSRLQGELGLSYLFISHDLAVVRHMAHRVAVLYRGRLLETGTAADVDERPAHPYTRALHAASPVPDPAVQRVRRATAAVEPVDLEPLDDGCPYRRRCPLATPVCATAPPVHRTGDHAVACHHPVPPPDRAPAAAATGPTGKDESR
ncbi:MAG TPA: ABC transporter ATP-binding protein, partial [Rugosimonospora sp.]|nr:ABC transporter ATP-binding protein [Rugosimonospora sp.]